MNGGIEMLELRVLMYFLMVCETENITKAAERLHLTQPTLTRQMHDLEEELGVILFIRGKRKTTLTEEGRLLKKRAEEMKLLMEKTQSELTNFDEVMEGDVHIGCAETDGMRQVARVISRIQKEYPRIHFHMTSGDEAEVLERLDKGLLDFGVLISPGHLSRYDFLRFSEKDVWGVLMKKGSPLASCHVISMNDLEGAPLIVSRQADANKELDGWFGGKRNTLDIRADYNLIFNAALLVEEGVGYALSLDRLVRVSDYNSSLTFRPLTPTVEASIYCIWQKNQIFSKAALYFKRELEKEIKGGG